MPPGGGKMGELRVDPAEVHRSVVELGEIATTLKSAFSSSDSAIAAAQSGWVGQSAAALAAKAAEWQKSTQVHHETLVEHADKFRTAARMYGHTDEAGADSVNRAAEGIS